MPRKRSKLIATQNHRSRTCIHAQRGIDTGRKRRLNRFDYNAGRLKPDGQLGYKFRSWKIKKRYRRLICNRDTRLIREVGGDTRRERNQSSSCPRNINCTIIVRELTAAPLRKIRSVVEISNNEAPLRGEKIRDLHLRLTKFQFCDKHR